MRVFFISIVLILCVVFYRLSVNNVYAGGCVCGGNGGNACHTNPFGQTICDNNGWAGELCCYYCGGGNGCPYTITQNSGGYDLCGRMDPPQLQSCGDPPVTTCKQSTGAVGDPGGNRAGVVVVMQIKSSVKQTAGAYRPVTPTPGEAGARAAPLAVPVVKAGPMLAELFNPKAVRSMIPMSGEAGVYAA